MSAISIPVGQSAVVVNALTASGNSFNFSFEPITTGSGKSMDALFLATGTFSAATGEIFVSPDGGTTWIDTGAAIDFTTAYQQVNNNFFPGVIYQFQFASFTGTSITVYCARS